MHADGGGHDDRRPGIPRAGDTPPWLEPYPDVLLDHLANQPPAPGARYGSTESISLAFITALQQLPPRQRAVLVLRDVEGYPAVEVASMLGITPEVVAADLADARATVDGCLAKSGRAGSVRRPDSSAEHRLIARLTDALARTDLNALIELLVPDVTLSMPSAVIEYRGVESARRALAAATFRPGRVYRVVPTRANRQPALGLYVADPRADVCHAHALLVITTAGNHITAITAFNTTIMGRFGLPRTLPKTH